MHKTRFFLATLGLLVVLAAAACAPAAPTAEPSAGGSANKPAAAVQTAPLCQSANTCQAPSATMNRIDCVNKMPYTNVLVEPGTKFEVLDKSGDFTCNDSGQTFNGKMVINCFGKALNSFQLKLTNSACGGATLAQGTGQCQQGYGYDAANQCCAPVSGDSGGSTTVKVDLGACPLPNSPYAPPGSTSTP